MQCPQAAEEETIQRMEAKRQTMMVVLQSGMPERTRVRNILCFREEE
jgi:hypothetical protein